MKLQELASKLGARLDPPDAQAEITGIAGIETATAGQVTFIANPKYTAEARTTKASAIIVDEKFPAIDKPLLRINNPQYAYLQTVKLFYEAPEYDAGVHPAASIHPSARIGQNASIGAFVVVEADVEIGDDCTLRPHVVIYPGTKIGKNFFAHSHVAVREHTQIGDNVILHNGVIIGSDGFGFAKDNDGRWQKIPQAGRVVIEDDVEVQANSCIDRASMGETRIGRGTKIDNLVQVAHNCLVGENSMLCAQVGLAGSTELGHDVILAGQVGVAGHCRIGDRVIVTAQSGTHGDIPDGSMFSGYPALDNKQWLRSVAVFNRLPELARAVRSGAKSGKPGKEG
jgi:UDP-3-O-[3-hydroxymyristoyl] glucosamine N-acyltransferase